MAEAAKERGNRLLASGDTLGALLEYTQAINDSLPTDPNKAIYWSNRSACFVKLQRYEDAIKDAEHCVETRPDWSKGYVRLGQALLLEGRRMEALEVFQRGLKIDPENEGLKKGRDEAKEQEGNGKKKRNNEEEQLEVCDMVVGIDLGTTFSCVGVWEKDNEKVTIIPDEEGRLTTPSIVSFVDLGNGKLDRRVGWEAKRMMSTNPTWTVFDAKRIIGQRFEDPQVQRDVAKFPFQVRGNSQTGKPEILLPNGTLFTPEEISAVVLGEMKRVAERFLKKRVIKAVVTVPAYFSDAQRQATKDAGRIAGLDVLRVVNEPTAAALAYGLDAKLKGTIRKNVVVFDLGGGTFDVSILTIEGGMFEVVATGGDTHLGGEDFDNNLVELLVSEIKKRFPDPKENVLVMELKKKRNRLRVLAEQAKIALSSGQTTKVPLDSLGFDGSTLEITRAQFEKINAEPFKRCIETVKNVIRDAKIKVDDVAEIVLVGGSTRIPAIRSQLRAFFKEKQLCQSINPDEAVAYGAAVQGAIMSSSSRQDSSTTKDLILVDVTPLSLGIETTGRVFSVVIPRNTTLPTERTKTYTTEEDFQDAIDVRIFEGERSSTDNNNLLGEFTISGIERAKRGIPKVEVTFAVTVDGMLKVSAKDAITKVAGSIVLAKNSGRLNETDISRMIMEAEAFRSQDEERRKRLELLHDLEDALRLCQEAQKNVNRAKEIQQWLDSVDDHNTLSLDDVRSKLDLLTF